MDENGKLLEIQAQRKLHLPRIAGARNHAELAWVLYIRRSRSSSGQIEVRMIEDVVGLGPEFKSQPLRNGEMLVE
jgi:hypothetical protein